MDQIELQATTREVLGKKVRFLRRQGVIPIHLFGHNVESVALQCDAAQLQRVLAQAGKTKLIDLKLDKAKRPRNVVVREVQRDPRTGGLLHVDFYQLRMAEKVKMDVPIVLAGEAPALKAKENTLSQELNSLTIECLPKQIPASIEVDLSHLTEVGQAIRVKDLVLDEEITVLNDPEVLVVKVHLQFRERVEEEIVEAAPEAALLPEEGSKEE
jgi:large subunit ribosomal protein L25